MQLDIRLPIGAEVQAYAYQDHRFNEPFLARLNEASGRKLERDRADFMRDVHLEGHVRGMPRT